MDRSHLNKNGAALYIVLGTLLIVFVLASIILTIISSQSRLTHHQISRIRAYYAAEAGMNLAFEQLRTGVWGAGSYTLCSSGCTVNDSDILYPVNITISAPDSTTGIRFLTITSTYTYSP